MNWVFLSILAALGDSIIFLCFKKLRNIDYYFAAWLKYTLALPLLIIYLFFSEIPEIDAIFVVAVILHSIVVFYAHYLIMKATHVSDLGKAIPMLSFTPLFLILVAFIINNEFPNSYGIFGILLITIGAYILHIKNGQSLIEPFKSLFNQKGTFLMLIVAFLFSLSASFGKLGVDHGNGAFFSFATYAFITVAFSAVFFKNTNKRVIELKNNKNYAIILGISAAVMILAASIAMETTFVTYVIALKRFSVLFSVFLGYYFFKEKNIGQNLFGTILMLAGAIIISVFNA